MVGAIVLLIVLILILLILASYIKIVPQAQAYVVERLGAYQGTWSVGMKFKMPFIDKIARKVNLKEQVVDFAPQPVITKDNVTMRIDTVVFFQITDPKAYTYGVENPLMAIDGHHAAQYHRRPGTGSDADLEGDHQYQDESFPGCGDGSLGH